MEHKGILYESNPKSFAHGLNFYKLFWIFLIGSIIGFILESIWCIIVFGHLESRKGFIYGPVTPIYGLGAVAMSIVLTRFKESSGFIVFIISAVVGGTFEYLGSLAQELVTGTVSWHYNTPLNLNGRTNLAFSICWGILGLLFIRYVLPVMSKLIEKLPNTFGKWLTIILTVLMLFDFIISTAAIRREVERIHLEPPSDAFDVFLDSHYDDNFLKNIYPNMILPDQ